MSQAADRAFYLDVAGEAVLCRLQPATGPASGRAVVLVPPFGWDEICSYRPRRAWARHLAQHGTPVLRLDLPGTGDSAGGPRDPGRVEAWTAAVATAATWLAHEAPQARLTLVGLGLGGLIAWRAAAQGAAADDLVLWGTPSRGKALVREVRAFSRLERSRLAELNPGRTLPPDDDGVLVANGFTLSAETIAALSAIDLTTVPLPEAHGRRVLLLGRDGVAADDALRAAAEAQGAAVAVDPGRGWGAMVDEPSVSRAPHETFAVVDAWLAQAPAERICAPAADAPPAQAEAEATIATEHGAVRERPVRVEGLDGIRTDPPAGVAQAGRTLLLLNSGSIRRVGPNRMWVEVARRWAARGVPSVRLDFDAIGEADGAENFAEDELRYARDPLFGQQATAVVRALGAGADAEETFGSIGLCSGAYWSLQAALADERVRSVYAINPRTLVWDEGLVAARDSRKIALLGRASTYRRVLRGDIPVARGVEIVRALAARALDALRARVRRRGPTATAAAPAADELAARLDRLGAHGQRLHLLFTDAEPVHEELERDGYLERLHRWPAVQLRVVDELRDVHTVQPLAIQRRIHALLDEAISADLAADGTQLAA